jgi:type I restriction enzyme S subunit
MSDRYNNLPRSWVSITIGEVTQPGVEQAPPEGDKPFLYVDISSIDNRAKKIVDPKILPVADAPSRARQRLKAHDVLVSMTRPNLNAVAILPSEFEGAIGSTGFDVLRAQWIDPSWLLYFVQTDDFVQAMSRLVQGVLYPAVRPKDIRSYPLPVAPLSEQRRIVAEIEKQFTRLEAGVAALKRVQANLKRYRATVLKAAVEGRLVPTEAELARREGRSYEPADELLKRILAERRDRWEADQLARSRASGKLPKDDKWKQKYKEPSEPETAGLPSLPEDWTWTTAEQSSWPVQYGSSAKTSEEPGGVPVLRMINITSDGRLNLEDLKYLPPNHNEFPDLLLQAGDLLFNRTNSPELVGKSAVYRAIPSPCSFASYLIRVRAIEGCSPTYLAFCLNSALGRTWIKSVVSQQVGQANVNGTKLRAFVFPLPPRAEQHRIVAEAERRLSVTDELELQLQTNVKRAERLRQAILKTRLRGQAGASGPGRRACQRPAGTHPRRKGVEIRSYPAR